MPDLALSGNSSAETDERLCTVSMILRRQDGDEDARR